MLLNANETSSKEIEEALINVRFFKKQRNDSKDLNQFKERGESNNKMNLIKKTEAMLRYLKQQASAISFCFFSLFFSSFGYTQLTNLAARQFLHHAYNTAVPV